MPEIKILAEILLVYHRSAHLIAMTIKRRHYA